MPILDYPVPKETYIFRAFDLLGFRVPGSYLRLLNDQYVDRITNYNRWQQFVQTTYQDWRVSLAIVSRLVLVSLPSHSLFGTGFRNTDVCHLDR